MSEVPEAPTFLDGIRLAASGGAEPAGVTRVYAAYDKEAIGRYLRPPEHPGVDPIQTAAIVPGAFRSMAIPMKNFPVSKRWAPIYRAISGCAGNACDRKSPGFAELVDLARHDAFLAKLDRVNRGVNRLIAYKRDVANYGSLDHWAKPEQILKRGAGDCEDFAILKMAALLDAGVPARSMSLVVLHDTEKRVFHAVLTVATGSGTFVLDNVRDRVVKDVDLPSYLPLYSFSTDRAWIHGAKGGGTRVAGSNAGYSAVVPGEGPAAGLTSP
ncbi:transglutaminase-like cysteine peptidase [Mesorhizobium marinum]|uniref:Transglutaminase-like cysteine peptidase n=1 Tax=Mesorhizobium marinum TaxID=3228790 RepID=A0ABV3R5G6_9HYPH